MGLKTTNYVAKNTGEVYETAYAILSNLTIKGENAEAIFSIHRDREKCFEFDPLETKRLFFTIDRNKNPYETAYQKAKEKVVQKVYNSNARLLETLEVDGLFTGWEDDYL